MPIKPNEVVLIDRQGNRRVFDRDKEAQLALRQGYRNETQEEYRERLSKEALSTPLEQVKTFAAGAARGATFGISDVLLSRADERARAGLEARREVSPGVSVAGEIAGALAGTKVGAGKALAAGAERLAAGAAERVSGSILRKALKSVISEGTQGAAYGLGQTISEEALDSEPGVNAERLIANVGIGALIGGGAGGLLGLAGGGAGKAAEKTKGLLGGEKANSESWLRDAIERHTKRSASKSLGAEPGAYKKLAKKSQTFDEVVDELGGFLSNEKGPDGKFLIEKGDNVEKIYDKIRTYRQQVGKQIGDHHEALYEISGASPVNTARFFDEAHSLISKHGDSVVPEMQARGKKLGDLIENIEGRYLAPGDTTAKMTLESAERVRRDIDAIVYPKKIPGGGISQASPMQEDLQHLARVLQEDIAKHVDGLAKVAGDAGKAAVETYRDLNRKYSFLKKAEAIANRGVMRKFSNRAFSPSDYLTAIGGTASGAAAFGPLGIPLGIGAGVINKILRERSRATMTAIGRWALTKESALASTVRTQAKISKAARGLLKAPRPKPGLLAGIAYPAATREPREKEVKEYRRVQDKITRFAGDPRGLFDDMQRRTAELSDAMPNIGQAAQIKMMQVMEYLGSKMPNDKPMDPLRPGHDTAPARQDIQRFMRLVDLARDPTIILDQMEHGRIPTVDEMDFLRACFPQIAQEVTNELMEAISKHGGLLDYQQRINIARVMGIRSTKRPQQVITEQQAQQEEQQRKDEFKLTASASKNIGKRLEQDAKDIVIN